MASSTQITFTGDGTSIQIDPLVCPIASGTTQVQFINNCSFSIVIRIINHGFFDDVNTHHIFVVPPSGGTVTKNLKSMKAGTNTQYEVYVPGTQDIGDPPSMIIN